MLASADDDVFQNVPDQSINFQEALNRQLKRLGNE